MKIVKRFRLKIVIFTAVKNRCMLHERVFVMIFIAVKMTFFMKSMLFFLISAQN